MWDAYAAKDYDRTLALAVSLGPENDQGLRRVAEEHVAKESARAKARNDVAALSEADAEYWIAAARPLLLDVRDHGLGPSSDPRLLDALGHLDRALALEPDNVDALALTWSVHAERGAKAEARAVARRLAEINPTPEALLRLAREVGDRLERFALTMAALQVGGEAATIAEELDHFVTGHPDRLSVAAGDVLAELSKVDTHAALLWGNRLQRAGRIEQAIATWQRCASDESIRWKLEHALRGLGRDDEADALSRDA